MFYYKKHRINIITKTGKKQLNIIKKTKKKLREKKERSTKIYQTMKKDIISERSKNRYYEM